MTQSCCNVGDVAMGARRPRLDVIETADAYLLEADLPGVSPDGLDVRIEQGVLTIEATAAPGDAARTVLRRESPRNAFSRRVRIGDGVDAEGVTAAMEDGVLRLTLPKSANQRSRRIEVQPPA